MPSTGVKIERFLQGDDSVMEALLGMFREPVWFYLKQKIPAGDVEDLFHDVVIAGFNGLARLEDPDKLVPWMLAITRRKVQAYYRQRDQTHTAFAEDQQHAPYLPGQGLSQERNLRLGKIHRCINQLREPFQEAAILHFILGMSYREVARIMDCNENTAKARINRAKIMIFKCASGGKPC